MNTTQLKPDVIVICGPTSVGKTSVGIELAKYFNGEIVSADSMQIYRYMNIGTAKPTEAEQAEVPHHMINIIDPDEPFDAETYSTMARKKIRSLANKGTVPFIVGGTGFYIKALEYGLFDPGPSNPTIRERLRAEAETYGPDFLYEQLIKADPDIATNIHPNDTYRIIRALEVYEMTGKGISIHQNNHSFSDNLFRVLKISLQMERKELYERIDQRVDWMIEAGFVDEVQGLLNRGYHAGLKSMQSIGYRHITDFINKQISWDDAVRTMKRDTRRYAKRQFAWFNADDSVKWFEPRQMEQLHSLVDGFLQPDEYHPD